MAFGRNLAHRFLDIAKTYSGQIRSGYGAGAARSSEQGSVLRRFLPGSAAERGTQWRPIVQAAVPPDRLSIPIGIKLFDRMSWPKPDHQQRDKLAPPPPPPLSQIFSEGKVEERGRMAMTVKEVRKVMKASQMELVRSKLREISDGSISSSEFLRICSEFSSAEEGPELARTLDESGAVIVLGNIVFIKPDQVAKAIENMIPLSFSTQHDPRNEELKKLELQKEKIDKLAAGRARKELWCGLAFLTAQTAGFMRLTFWELSWDVMEPICFFVTSFYFMAGYIFFMKTSTEPSFEGFFQRRFATKQRRLMKAHKFDLCRFNELKGVICSSTPSQLTSEFARVSPPSCDCMNKKNALAGYAC